MSNFEAYKNKALRVPEVKAEYDALQSEYDKIQSTIDAGNAEDAAHNQKDQKS